MVSFFDKNPDIDKEIVGNLRNIENDVQDLQNKFCKLEERVLSLENQLGKHQDETKRQLEKHQEDTKYQLEKTSHLFEKHQEEVKRRLTAVTKMSENSDQLTHQKDGLTSIKGQKRKSTHDQKGPAAKRISSYQQEMDHLRDDLKACYKFYSTIPISPIDEDETTPLQDFYMDVMIEHQTKEKCTKKTDAQNTIKDNTGVGGNSRNRETEMLSSYKQIFLDKRNQRIILTGLSGSGKSTFCRKVVNTWCTEEPDKQNETTQETDLSIPDSQKVMADKKETGQPVSDSPEAIAHEKKESSIVISCEATTVEELDLSEVIADEDILLQFSLLFYIYAPEISNEKTLTEVLCNQCLKRESDQLSTFLEKQAEKVLIILDGMDEMGGKIPSLLSDLLRRKLHPRVIVLMAMRPWKISQLGLKPSSHYDLLLEVQGFSGNNALKFVQKVVNRFNENNRIKRLFPSPEEQNVLLSFRKIPLLLLFLAHIWCQDQSLPTQQQDLYRKILECMIERCIRKRGNKYTPELTDMDDISIKKKIFWDTYLESACQAAYYFLLQWKGGSSVLMLEKDLMNQLGDNALLKLSALLDCGILSKLDAFSPLEKKISITFLHLSIHEYLTSMHLVSNEDEFQYFLKCLKTLSDVLRYENLFIFFCGLDAKKGHMALTKICQVCDEDRLVIKYRQGRDYDMQIESSVENLNEMYRACLNEIDSQEYVAVSDIRVHFNYE